MWIWEKEKCKWKWRIYLRKRKNCANESSESRTNRLATQSQYQRRKTSNELAQCREERLFNQRQYQKENIKNGSADLIKQERLADQHQYQNEKNVYSATITDEIRKFHATAQSTFCSLLTSCGINTVSLLLKILSFQPYCRKIFTVLTATDFLEGSERAQIYNIAPGERSVPLQLSIFRDKYSEELSYPGIFLRQKRPGNDDRLVDVHYSDIR